MFLLPVNNCVVIFLAFVIRIVSVACNDDIVLVSHSVVSVYDVNIDC